MGKSGEKFIRHLFIPINFVILKLIAIVNRMEISKINNFRKRNEKKRNSFFEHEQEEIYKKLWIFPLLSLIKR